jgi:hypothetical protein
MSGLFLSTCHRKTVLLSSIMTWEEFGQLRDGFIYPGSMSLFWAIFLETNVTIIYLYPIRSCNLRPKLSIFSSNFWQNSFINNQIGPSFKSKSSYGVTSISDFVQHRRGRLHLPDRGPRPARSSHPRSGADFSKLRFLRAKFSANFSVLEIWAKFHPNRLFR